MKENFFYDWLVKAIGKKLLSVIGSFHIFRGVRNGLPQEICFLFEGHKLGRIYGASDGESILFSLSPSEEYSMDEYGDVKNSCISNEMYFSDVVNKKMISAKIIFCLKNKKNMGVVFFLRMMVSLL